MFLAYAITGGVALASFVSTMLLARIAGPAVIGDYALAMSTATLLASFAILGLDRILIREVAGDLREGNDGRARAAVRTITMTIAATALLTAGLYGGALFATPLVARIGGGNAMLVVIAAVLIRPLLYSGISGLRGAGAPVLGQLFESASTYVFMLAMVPIFLLGLVPTAAEATALMVAGQLLALFLAWAFLARRMRHWRPDGSNDGHQTFERRMLLAGLPVMGSLFLQLFSDWMLLARLSATMGAAETGAFRVAIQITAIIATVVATTESYASAEIAAEFRAGRPDRAWAHHRKATLLMLGLTAPVFLLLWTVPDLLLGLLFGPGFAIAAPAIAILAIGQLASVLRGPLGSMLIMSGNQRIDLALTMGSLVLTIALLLLLIPRHGLEGAAVAQISGLMFRAGVGYLVARRLIPNRAGPTEETAP